MSQRNHSFADFPRISAWPVYAGCAWALLYAVLIRFYQAAGGTIGLPGTIHDPDAFRQASYNAGVAITVCAFILLALANPGRRALFPRIPWIGRRRVQRFALLAPTLFFSCILLAHGVAGMLRNVLFLTGSISIDLPLFDTVNLRLFSLWDLLVYELWFLIMGVLSGLAAAHYAQSSGVSPSAIRVGALLYSLVSLLASALLLYAVLA
ncbi:DUF3995 domain-containing protein [Cohnella zeiphila]|uniref:DUF3995 domain-containing protein n=1 Tax=Cohnella zeiphila TaxID=2761120 RepID=A0A7X0VXF2_9BACL|nr:DUF3995 domain-containing protein [Cohnella zeiphila]MBB6733956.1 DUF3995 domain-containing protein [Cohnella zeiphila]